MFFVRLIPQRNALVHHIEKCLIIPGLDLQPLRFSMLHISSCLQLSKDGQNMLRRCFGTPTGHDPGTWFLRHLEMPSALHPGAIHVTTIDKGHLCSLAIGF